MAENSKNNQVRNILFYGLFALIGLLIALIIMLAAMPDFTLNTLGFRSYISHYDTMEPKIKPYDLVFINRVDTADLAPEDLITFYADINYDGDDELVTYYIYDIDDSLGYNVYRVHAEGVNTPATPYLIDSDIMGGYSFRIPGIGLVIDFIASPFGIAVVFVNVAIIAGIVFVVKHGNKEKKEQNSENKA